MHSQAELVFREGPTRDFMKGGSRQRRTLTRVVETWLYLRTAQAGRTAVKRGKPAGR